MRFRSGRCIGRSISASLSSTPSNLYGNGHSEELIGEAFARRRDKVVIATKAGRGDYDTEAYEPSELRRSVEASLRRLRSDYVDVVQVHSPSSMDVLKRHDVMGTLGRLKSEGKIRAVGISVKAPGDGVPAIRELGAEVIQINFNLVDQRASDGELLRVAREIGAGVIGRTPLCFGMLSGKVAPETVFDARDHRSLWSKAQIARWIEASSMFVQAVAEKGRQTPAQVALRFLPLLSGNFEHDSRNAEPAGGRRKTRPPAISARLHHPTLTGSCTSTATTISSCAAAPKQTCNLRPAPSDMLRNKTSRTHRKHDNISL